MSAAADSPAGGGAAFSPRTVLTLVLVGLVALAGFAVLSAYAPELRARGDPGAHALSGSAVGFRGATILLGRLGTPVQVSRGRVDARVLGASVLVLTPPPGTSAKELAAVPRGLNTLIVLPKWIAPRDPTRPGFVRKGPPIGQPELAAEMLKAYAPKTQLALRPGPSRPVLRGIASPFAAGAVFPLGPVDRLQTISGDGWIPALVDEQGRAVLAYSHSRPDVMVLADPDLLNDQGLADLQTARAGIAILQASGGDGGVVFDVTLNGFRAGQNLGRLMLQPPWLAATLCVLAAAVLMGLHALARFGPTERIGRAVALGAAALVDNSAGLIRMAHKEPQLAPDYLETIKAQVAKAAGGGPGADGDRDGWLARLAHGRGLPGPDELAHEIQAATSRDALVAAARKLHHWRREMTGEG